MQLTEIAGWGEETLKTIEYYQGVQTGCETVSGIYACNFKPVLEFNPKMTIDGDGTVVTSSALWTPGANKYWVNLGSYNEWLKTGNIPRRHSDIFEVPELREFLSNLVVRNGNIPENYISTSAPQYTGTVSRLHFTLHSPLSLSLTDGDGKHTGISATGEIEENIPGSRYMTFGDVKYISVPASTKLHLEMKGYETGSFTLKIEEKQGDTSNMETTFAGIPSNSVTTATMDIPANGRIVGASPLSVDENGDGKAEMTFTAKLGDTVLPDFNNPEAKISVDPTTKDLKIEGVDESLTTVTKSGSNYVITDSSGNSTTLFFQKTYLGKLLTYAKLTGIQYGKNPKISLPSSSFLYLWNPLVNPPVLLSQTIVVNSTYGIEAVYDKKKNQTTVFLKKKGVQIQKQIFTGLRVVQLTVDKGTVGYVI